MGRRHARLVHLASALVGSPHPDLVRTRRRGGLRRPRRAGPRGLRPGDRRARHVVLVGIVAVLDARLAGRYPRLREVLSQLGARHGLRHPVLLGRPDDDVRYLRRQGFRRRQEGAVPQPVPARTRARRARPQDVEVTRQRHRSPRLGRPFRRRRAAVHTCPWRESRIGHLCRRGSRPVIAQLRDQAVQRHQVRPDERCAGACGRRATRRRRPDRRRPLDSRAPRRGSRRGRRRIRLVRVLQGMRGAVSLRVGRGLRLVPRARESAVRTR